MASLANAKQGEVVVMKSGKRIVSDGKGGGKAERKTKKAILRVPKSDGKKPNKKKVKPKTTPASNSSTARGLRSLATRGDTVADLVKQTKSR